MKKVEPTEKFLRACYEFIDSLDGMMDDEEVKTGEEINEAEVFITNSGIIRFRFVEGSHTEIYYKLEHDSLHASYWILKEVNYG